MRSTIMSWKLILAAILVLALALWAAYASGGHLAAKEAVAQCNTDRATDKTAYTAGQVAAEERGRKAQKEADAVALADTERLLSQAQAQAVQAQKTASEAKAIADTLNRELTRLKHDDPSVRTWNDTCLPPALLRSLHGSEIAPVASSCR